MVFYFTNDDGWGSHETTIKTPSPCLKRSNNRQGWSWKSHHTQGREDTRRCNTRDIRCKSRASEPNTHIHPHSFDSHKERTVYRRRGCDCPDCHRTQHKDSCTRFQTDPRTACTSIQPRHKVFGTASLLYIISSSKLPLFFVFPLVACVERCLFFFSMTFLF